MDLFELGQQWFQQFTHEFAGYGLEIDPKLELRRTTGLLCYYNLQDGQIYLSVPSIDTPAHELHTLILSGLMGCKNTEELLRFCALFIPWLIAHELGHYYRHRYGLFGANLWHEEQVANQLASAMTKHRLTPTEKQFGISIIRHALENLAEKVESKQGAALSYGNVLDALNVLGYIGEADGETMHVLEKLFAFSPEQVLRANDQLAQNLDTSLTERDQMIAAINEAYVSDRLQYMYAHLSWAYIDLISQTEHYVDEFAREQLNRRVPLLPRLTHAAPNAVHIQACYQAFSETQTHSNDAAHYFHQRYRTLLLQKLESLVKPDGAPLLDRQTIAYLQNWNQGETDTLDYATHLAPTLRALAPSRIEARLDPSLNLEIDLPTETDRRLWRHVVHGARDEGAANTLERLKLLYLADLFRAVPPEAMLDLVHSLCHMRMAPGETLIWENDRDNDVYVITRGEMEILRSKGASLQRVALLGPGETVGEIEFITRQARSATVRATNDVDLLVLRDADLQILCLDYPSILLQIAGSLTRLVQRHSASS